MENSIKLFCGDNINVLKDIPDNSVDSIVTDAPYGLKFMGKSWDYDVPSEEIWKECFRVLKHGGHLLAFFGTRTYHRGAVRIEDAGFEIKDQVQWNFGSGFPKSLNVYKSALKQGIICSCDVDCGNESLRNLPEEMGAEESLPESAESNVLQRMQSSASIQKDDGQKKGVNQNDSDKLSSLPNADSEKELLAQESYNSSMQSRVQRQASSDEPSKVQQQRAREKASWQGSCSREESSLEGRSDLQEEQGQLHRPEVCEMSSRVSSDGSEGWVCDGASVSDCHASESFVISDRGCSSLGSQHAQQLDSESRALAEQQKSQASRTWERCSACLKPIYPEDLKGYGTALKPANEPIVVARKPLEKGLTVAQNVLKYGTGALNIDGSRISMTEEDRASVQAKANKKDTTNNIISGFGNNTSTYGDWSLSKGRWPANIILDEIAAKVLDGQQSEVSRFFYVAKASKSERNAGLEGMPKGEPPASARSKPAEGRQNALGEGRENFHPTVKPLKLMSYLINLVTPPNGIVLDPFMGSGSTGVAAKELGFGFVGIERDSEYFKIAETRIKNANPTIKIKEPKEDQLELCAE